MKVLKSLFAFDKKQQRGILFLMILLILVLGGFTYLKNRPSINLVVIDSTDHQAKIDSLKAAASRKKDTIYAFNPNYITDYRGYKLGLSLKEIDKLHRFRESGKFVNSASDFQEVTGVSSKWLDSIAPHFKFPAWVTNANNGKKKNFTSSRFNKAIVIKDINTATALELRKVYGIGPALSGRILIERDRLGGYIDIMQVREVYGLTDSTVTQLKKHFFIKKQTGFDKIALNTATREDLLSIPYFNDYLVNELIKQRKLRDGFSDWKKVMLTSRFPEEKLQLIQLYLTLD
jgi:DNA uptake protein ComE-like DNA-binding protein